MTTDQDKKLEKIKTWINTETNVRLDSAISKQIQILSKNDANLLCAQGKVKLNNSNAEVKAGESVKCGDQIEVDFSHLNFSARPELGAALLPLKILFEDEYFLVLHKPRSLHSVTQKSNPAVSLADALSAYCPACLTASKDPFEAGLIQRLDYWTTGLMLAAKNKMTHKILSLMLLSGKIKKTYLALVEGNFREREKLIKTVLESQAQVVKTLALEDVPDYVDKSSLIIRETRASFEKTIDARSTLVQAVATAAYRHQIRVHLAFAGFPLVGDTQYGSLMTLKDLQGVSQFQELQATYGVLAAEEGFFLCANSLDFVHPYTQERLLFRI
ncbi:MAG: RluA family pseudouridine synthase [Deltaproteobacteria bacterium]|jgi:23S rRNA pseudouridine1911/1915/1917 synthase|nr:RluA family pseudouridine synthase [Deltaproteobacteria bacterium]